MSIPAYVAAVQSEAARGNATEHTFRPALKALIEALEPSIAATNEPRRIACGAPDFQITRGQLPVGHIEAKDLHVDLDRELRSGQMARYLKALPNLILTNYLEFRWFVNGEQRDAARIARCTPLSSPRQRGESGGYKIIHEPQGEMELQRLLSGFLAQQPPVVGTPHELALRLAEMTRLLRGLIAETFTREGKRGELHEQYDAFKKALIPGLETDEFADMYAQTLAYGLFAARVGTPLPPAPSLQQPHPPTPSPRAERGRRGGDGGEVSGKAERGSRASGGGEVSSAGGKVAFSRQSAAVLLPKTNPFLRRLFYEIAGPDLDDRIAWAVDDIAALLQRADMDEILRDFGRRTRQEDPVVHFYETFLAAYDPKMRESRGVYYTPEPVVSFIVRSVDHLLRTRFGKALGLADQDTLILDPATGTATFMYFVVERIYEILQQNGLAAGWNSYVGDGDKSLLRRLFGFELLMAPYAVAHLKLGLQLRERGYDFRSHERLGVYLTNALDEGVPAQTAMPFARYIAEESEAAAEIKSSKPIMVVLGNPPYSGHSENNSPFIRKLIDDYMRVDGAPLGERNPKWLQDDYVKFIRFGQWRIGQTGEGVLAYISNNGYLDNPTFRGMRQSLMASFDDIYILNLHGNSNKKERAPNGGPDENVFDIRQGVAIALFVKRRSPHPPPPAPQQPHAPALAPQQPHPPPPSPQAERGRRGGDGGEVASDGGEVQSATIHYADLWGPRAGKYAALAEQDIASIAWQRLAPSSPFYLFVPQDVDLREEYERGWNLANVMLINGMGMNSHRDAFVIDFEKDVLTQRLQAFRDTVASSEIIENSFGVKKTGDFDPLLAQRALQELANWDSQLVECLYRPFDFRYVFFHDALIDRPRTELNQNMLQPNVSLATTRQTREPFGVLATDRLCGQHKIVATYDGSSIFPLYLYPSQNGTRRQTTLFDEPDAGSGPSGRRANLSPAFIRELTEKLHVGWVADGKGNVTASVPHPPAPSLQQPHLPTPSQQQPLPQPPSPRAERGSRGGGGGEVHSSKAERGSRASGGGEVPSDGGEVPSDGHADITIGPEDVFHYAYAVFHSPTYRERYAELLKIDFPRLPLTSDPALFANLAALGAELVDLHLLRLPVAQHPSASGGTEGGVVGGNGGAAALVNLRTAFPVSGSNIVEKVSYDAAQQRVYINKQQYFEGVDAHTWGFRVGGYQVLDKWLKDRKGRALSFNDLLHYQRVVVALAETQRIMAAIDARIPAWPIA